MTTQVDPTAIELASKVAGTRSIVVRSELNASEVEELQDLLQYRHAANTKRAYDGVRRHFTVFCAERFPDLRDVEQCTRDQVAAYLLELSKTKRVTTVQHRLAGVKHFARRLSFDEWRQLSELLSTIRRKLADTPQSAPGGKDALLTDDLKKLVAALGTEQTKTAVRNRALLLVLFFSAMRRSEVAALQWRDIAEKSTATVLTIRKSKTDQNGVGQSAPLYPKADEPSRCPVSALRAWKTAMNPSSLNVPVFPHLYKGAVVETEAMGDQRMYRLVKELCTTAELDSSRFGCHSFRSGAITQGAMNGIKIEELQKLARHRSIETTAGYTKRTDLLAEDAPLRKL
jgi:integrase